jgi:hypothetical protein
MADRMRAAGMPWRLPCRRRWYGRQNKARSGKLQGIFGAMLQTFKDTLVDAEKEEEAPAPSASARLRV